MDLSQKFYELQEKMNKIENKIKEISQSRETEKPDDWFRLNRFMEDEESGLMFIDLIWFLYIWDFKPEK